MIFNGTEHRNMKTTLTEKIEFLLKMRALNILPRSCYGFLGLDGIYVCDYCLRPCSSENVLNDHIRLCERHPPQQTRYPNPVHGAKVNERCNVTTRFVMLEGA